MDKFEQYVKSLGPVVRMIIYTMITESITDLDGLAEETGYGKRHISTMLAKVRSDLRVENNAGMVAEFCSRGYHERHLEDWGTGRDGLPGFCDSVFD